MCGCGVVWNLEVAVWAQGGQKVEPFLACTSIVDQTTKSQPLSSPPEQLTSTCRLLRSDTTPSCKVLRVFA